MSIKQAIKRGVMAGALVATIAGSLFTFGVFDKTSAETYVSGPRDYDYTSVIYGGALSTAELRADYDANRTGDIDDIYNNFGISRDDIYSLSNRTVVGIVRADNTVWVGDRLIGVNAVTAGRAKTTHSVQIPGTNAYRRPPSDSFARPTTTIKIFIGFHGEIGNWAIITSCGNPLTWDRGGVAVEKTVSKDGGKTFAENVEVGSGDEVTFKLDIREVSGKAGLYNVFYSDKLPANFDYVPGSTMLDGKKTFDITAGPQKIDYLPAGGKHSITFRAKAKLVNIECGSQTVVNRAELKPEISRTVDNTASVTITEVCQPVFSCKTLDVIGSLPASLYPGQQVELKLIAGTIEYTNLKNYIFNVNGAQVQASMTDDTYTFTAPATAGNYTITGQIQTDAGTTGVSGACTKTVKVVDRPVVACDLITGPGELYVGQAANFAVKTSGDANYIDHIEWSFNGKQKGGYGDTYSFTPAEPGQYTISATVTPKSPAVVKGGDDTCVKTFTVKPVIAQCKSFTTSKYELNKGEAVEFTTRVNVDGTQVKEYVYFVNGKEVERTASNKFVFSSNEHGTYKVAAKVAFNNGVVDTNANCEKTVKVNPTIVTACNLLTGPTSLKEGESATYTVSATAEYTTASEYVFSVDGEVVKRSSENTYNYLATAGDHKIKVSVKFANGDVKTSADCEKTVHVEKNPEPIYGCTSFKLSDNVVKLNTKVTATVKVVAENGAVFDAAKVDFGEGSVVLAEVDGNTATANYTYAKAGEKNVTVRLAFIVNGELVTIDGGKDCTAEVEVTEQKMCPVPGKENLPVDDENCYVPCEIEGKEDLKADDDNCKEDEKPKPQVLAAKLPDTGAGSIAGLMASVTVAGTALHRRYSLRRSK